MHDVTENELTRTWSDATLAALPRGETYWNPFGVLIMAGDKVAEELGKRWVQLHDGPHGGPVPEPKGGEPDPLDTLRSAAALKMACVHNVTHPETGEVLAFYPARQSSYSRQDEDAWEQRCLAMHVNQEHLAVPQKPKEVAVRPSWHQMQSSQPVNFEDLSADEKARILNPHLTRGD